MDLWLRNQVERGTPTPYRPPGRKSAPQSPRQRTGTRDISVTVLLPAYNEAVALPAVLDALFSALGDDSEVIVVDDGSTDNTAAIAASYGCRVLRHPHNRGKGAAVRTGLAAASGQFVIVMDADNTYPANTIPRMIELGAHYDFVRCIRTSGIVNMPPINRLGNKLFDWMLKVVHGLEGADHLSGLYGLRREALQDLCITADRFDLEVEIGIKARARRLRAAVVPIDYGERLGEKKLHAYRDGWVILHRVLSMSLLYNPGLAFVVPGLLLGVLTALLLVVLSAGPATVSDDHLMLAVLGSTVAFQLVVFGVVAGLYGVEQGAAPRRWLLALGQRGVRRAAILVGTASLVVGAVTLLILLGGWLFSGGRDFPAVGAVAAAGALLTCGMDVTLAALFVSLFAGHLLAQPPRAAERRTIERAAERQTIEPAPQPSVLERPPQAVPRPSEEFGHARAR
jgi:Glycosyl transferase family 2